MARPEYEPDRAPVDLLTLPMLAAVNQVPQNLLRRMVTGGALTPDCIVLAGRGSTPLFARRRITELSHIIEQCTKKL